VTGEVIILQSPEVLSTLSLLLYLSIPLAQPALSRTALLTVKRACTSGVEKEEKPPRF
jgi:hypothetical protein